MCFKTKQNKQNLSPVLPLAILLHKGHLAIFHPFIYSTNIYLALLMARILLGIAYSIVSKHAFMELIVQQVGK